MCRYVQNGAIASGRDLFLLCSNPFVCIPPVLVLLYTYYLPYIVYLVVSREHGLHVLVSLAHYRFMCRYTPRALASHNSAMYNCMYIAHVLDCGMTTCTTCLIHDDGDRMTQIVCLR